MRHASREIIGLIGALLISTTLFIAACGPGGIIAGGGIGGSGIISSGTIVLIGSAEVNGVLYRTDNALITLNGTVQPDDSGLRKGMVVRIDGALDIDPAGGNADAISYEQSVRGPVTGVDTSNPQSIVLTLLGQTVIVEQDVTFVDDGAGGVTTTLPVIVNGDAFEVSGLREAGSPNGAIRATYLKPETGLTEYVVKGVVENGTATGFTIAGLTITTDASTLGTIPPDGSLVAVSGTPAGFTPPSTLLAARIDTRIPGLGESESERAEVEGFLDDLSIGAGTFTLDGQPIRFSSATQFTAGTIDDLANGARIEAEGPMSGGIVEADTIRFKDVIRIEGDALDDDLDGSFTVDGLAGLTIHVDLALTQYDGFIFPGVAAGDHLRIRGRSIGTGHILATEIRLRNVDTRIELQGPVSSITSPPGDNVTILETVTIPTSGAFLFFVADGTPLDRNGFYAGLEIGDLVKARGDLTGPGLASWKEIELEQD